MFEKEYTHIDKDGVLWRFEDGRPVSKIADEVIEEVFGDKKEIFSCEALPMREILAKRLPALDLSVFSMTNNGLPRFAIHKINKMTVSDFSLVISVD
jgi:hypothetical protein